MPKFETEVVHLEFVLKANPRGCEKEEFVGTTAEAKLYLRRKLTEQDGYLGQVLSAEGFVLANVCPGGVL